MRFGFVLLPSKFIEPDQALLTLGGQILLQLNAPLSIAETWVRLNRWRTKQQMPSSVPFWWFALALDVTFSMGAVQLEHGLLRKLDHAPQPH
jgi:hypothetical protein